MFPVPAVVLIAATSVIRLGARFLGTEDTSMRAAIRRLRGRAVTSIRKLLKRVTNASSAAQMGTYKDLAPKLNDSKIWLIVSNLRIPRGI